MGAILLLAFLVVPLVEIAVFIEVGGALGLWPTLAVVVGTAIAGAALLRSQGLATWRRAEACLARGEPPVDEVFDGLCLLVAGVLLITPGFVTDVAGLLLFLPATRRGVRRLLWQAFVKAHSVEVRAFGAKRRDERRRDVIIEGEYREVPPREEKPD